MNNKALVVSFSILSFINFTSVAVGMEGASLPTESRFTAEDHAYWSTHEIEPSSTTVGGNKTLLKHPFLVAKHHLQISHYWYLQKEARAKQIASDTHNVSPSPTMNLPVMDIKSIKHVLSQAPEIAEEIELKQHEEETGTSPMDTGTPVQVSKGNSPGKRQSENS